MNGMKDIDMSNNEIIEYFRWYDIPDCKKYKELLTSKDRGVVKLAIELLVVDGVDAYQIRRCRENFLGSVYLGDGLIGQIMINESKYYGSSIPIVI